MKFLTVSIAGVIEAFFHRHPKSFFHRSKVTTTSAATDKANRQGFFDRIMAHKGDKDSTPVHSTPIPSTLGTTVHESLLDRAKHWVEGKLDSTPTHATTAKSMLDRAHNLFGRLKKITTPETLIDKASDLLDEAGKMFDKIRG